MNNLHGEREGGFFYKDQEYVHHSRLARVETAFYSLVSRQKAVILVFLSLVLGAFLLNWHATLVVIFSTLTVVYFFDFLFNAFIIYRSFSVRPEIKVSREELEALSDDELPMYTIFCPLYREWHILPQFVEAISKLDYPKDKLQVLLLLEEDDKETIEKIPEIKLLTNFERIVVPHSTPKTKPKAMNYGLRFVRGERLVIYDAEDIPEPDQLKKAVIAFKKSSERVVCVQAKLNFYNPYQNILTRLFSVEYSLWFDLVLPGLQSINAPIPLGGTSNHFKADYLRIVGGWDAFNVTEDCDLGMRLAKRGFRTAIVESTTYEEANSNAINWYRQRSRWIKGYIQTYLVHNRNQKEFFANNRIRDFLSFQLVVGAKVLALFINPVMWVITACYFLFRSKIGLFIESLFLGPIFYIGVFSLIFGNFLYIYYYMIGASKRGYDSLVKYVFLVPLYWLGMSIAAWKAVYEIIVSPHYWYKTAHGLHLGVKFEREQGKLIRYAFSGAGLLVISSLFVNVLNFLFNTHLSRHLSFAQFGTVSVISTLTFLLSLFAGALLTTANRVISYLDGAESGAGARFFKSKRFTVAVASIAAGVLWLLISPIAAGFFNLPDTLILTSFAAVILFSVLHSYNMGYLQGILRFGNVALASALEVASKLGIAVLLVGSGFKDFAALAFPGSVLLAWAASSVSASSALKTEKKTSAAPPSFPFSFYGAALMCGLSATVFLSLDVLLAKHYLSADDAGRYALLSLVGKMIFFFGSLLNVFIVTFVSRAEGEGKDPASSFRKIFYGTVFLTLSAGTGLYLFGQFLVPLFFGARAIEILPYIGLYSVGMMLFTLSATIVTYELARRRYIYSVISLIISLLLVFGIMLAHSSINDFVRTVAALNFAYLASVLAVKFFGDAIKKFGWNIADALGVFARIPKLSEPKAGRKKILIFNWRDIESVFAGGAEVYIHEIAKRWVADGNAVTIFASNDRQHPPHAVIDGVRVIRRGGFYAVYALALLYYILRFRGKFDVILDSENGIPFFTPLYAKEPVFCLLHHIHQEVFRKSLIWPLAVFASFLERRMMPLVYRNSRFITISESSRKSMADLKITKHEINIINPGVNLEYFRAGEKLKTPLVSYLGRLKDYKSVDILIAAFARVLEKIPAAFLVIAGDGEEDRNLRRIARDFGIRERVLFTGKISEERKRFLLQSSWVFVNPSMMEGWGITTIEANACGTAVVASDVPGLRDSVRNEETGFLSPYGNVDALSERILFFLQNNGARKLSEANALIWARNFSWEKSSQLFYELISGAEYPAASYEAALAE